MSTRPGTATALLVVDVQAGVVASAWQRDRIVANVALAVLRARAAGVPVLWVQHGDDDLPPGSDAWQWAAELDSQPGEPRIDKRHNSAFEGTDLAALLDARGISHLVLAGAASNWCIRATAHGALERGYDLTLLADAHTTEDMEVAPGRWLRAEAIVDELNTAMRWLSYPGRRNTVALAAEVGFSPAAG